MPEDKRHIFKTANIYLQEGRWDKAIVEFKRLVAIDPEDLSAHNILGDAYVKKGALKEAYKEYFAAAEGYGRRGEGDKANPIYRKISKLDAKDLDPEDAQKLQVISLIVSGDAAYEEGNIEAAAKAYEEVVRLSPGNVEVTYKLGDICARLGKTREAAANFQTVAKIYIEARLFKRALLCYQKVAELDPSNVDARLALADLLAREGQELEARKELQSITELFIAQGQLDKAQSCAQRAIQLKSIDAHYLMGEIFIRREMYEEARVSLESFLKIKANHIPGQFALGIALFKKGALDEALVAFGRILGKQSDHIEALERLAEIYEKKGAKLDAIVQHLNLAQVFLSQKIMDRAEAAIRKALALEPGHMDSHRRLGELFEMRGLRREAAQEYLAALKAAKEQNLANDIAQCEGKIRAIDPSLLDGKPAHAPKAEDMAPPMETLVPPKVEGMASLMETPAPPKAEGMAPPKVESVSPPKVESVSPPKVESVSPPKVETTAPVKAPEVPQLPPSIEASLTPELTIPTVALPAAAPKAKPTKAEPPAPALSVPPPTVARPAPGRPAAAALPTMDLPTFAAPLKPKAALTPEQRAQRMISMAQSALKQGLFDEALDMLQQAQQQVPNDQELKATVQNVIRKYATTAKGGKKLPAAFMMAAAVSKPAAADVPPAQTPAPVPTAPEPELSVGADEVEAQIVASAEKEYQERQEREREKEYQERHGREREREREQEREAAAKQATVKPAAVPAKAKSEDEMQPLTETMADIYLKQGHVDEALKIYEKLWKDTPDRADLEAKIEDLRRRKAPSEPAPPPPAASSRARPRISYV